MIRSDNFYRSFLLLSLFVCINLYARSQNNEYVDSLIVQLKTAKQDTNKVKLLHELCWELAFVQSEKAIRYGKESVALSTALNYTKGESIGHYYLGRIYVEIGQPELAMKETKMALKIDEKRKDLFGVASDHGQLGACHKSLGNYDKAMIHYYKCLELHEKLGNPFAAAQTKLNIASFSLHQGEYKTTMRLAREAQKVFEQLEAKQMLAMSYSLEASALFETGKGDQSLPLYKKSIALYQQIGDRIGEASTLNNMGLYFYEMDDSKNALDYMSRALAIQEELDIKTSVATTLANISLVYIQLGENDKSYEAINRSIAIGKEIGALHEVAGMMSYASEIYYLNGEYKKAYDYRLLSNQIRDTLFSMRKMEQMLDIQEKYEVEKKEKRIEILKKERDASEAKSRLVDTVIIFSVGTILLLIVLTFFIFRQRKAKERQRKLELEQKVLRAQMNPHFIFNSLNSIQRIFIEGDVDLANEYISDFGKLLRIILENNGKRHVSIKNEIETLKLYLDIESIRLEGKIQYHFDISPTIDLMNNFIPPLIIQPFVENAIWHGILPKEKEEMGVIVVTIRKESEKFLSCSIEDNGIGINTSVKMKGKNGHTSKGMSITEERLGHKIQVEEIQSGGTKVTLKIPLNL